MLKNLKVFLDQLQQDFWMLFAWMITQPQPAPQVEADIDTFLLEELEYPNTEFDANIDDFGTELADHIEKFDQHLAEHDDFLIDFDDCY